MVIHAAEDKLVTKKAVDNMMDAFKKHGVSAELVLVEGAAHGFGYNTKTPQQLCALGKMHEFVERI